MTVAFFLLIVISVGLGFSWVIQEMLFKGKWNYFIFFLLGFLPFYITSLSVIYLYSGSPGLLTIFQVVKELIVVAAAILFVFYQRKPFEYPISLRSTDAFFLGFMLLATLYLFLPLGEATFLNKMLYYKSILIPALIYFLGRNTSFSDFEINRVFYLIFAVAVGAFLVNCIESYILNAHLQQFSGYALYNQEINNIDPTGHFGLTWTFETSAVTKRLAGFFSDPLELASSVLIGFSSGLIWFLTSRKEYNWPYLIIMLCSVGSLTFSASRAAFVAFFVMLFFIALVFKLYRLIAMGFIGISVFVIYVLFFASDDFYYFVIDTLTFENTSSVGHVVEWLLALESMIASPTGIGMAMSGNFGSVEDDLRVGGENQFLIYGVQFGWLGMLLYIGMLWTGIRHAIKVFNTSDNLNISRIAFVAGTVKVGLLLPLFTANVEIYAYVSWVSWWMVGISVREYSLLKSPIHAKAL